MGNQPYQSPKAILAQVRVRGEGLGLGLGVRGLPDTSKFFPMSFSVGRAKSTVG